LVKPLANLALLVTSNLNLLKFVVSLVFLASSQLLVRPNARNANPAELLLVSLMVFACLVLNKLNPTEKLRFVNVILVSLDTVSMVLVKKILVTVATNALRVPVATKLVSLGTRLNPLVVSSWFVNLPMLKMLPSIVVFLNLTAWVVRIMNAVKTVVEFCALPACLATPRPLLAIVSNVLLKPALTVSSF
jgi:hypothetical protein